MGVNLREFKLILIVILLFFASHSQASDEQTNLKADHVKHYRKEQLLIATGNVKLETEDVDIYSDEMEIDLETNKLVATGNVKTEGEGEEFYSKELDYDLKADEGVFIDSEGTIISDEAEEPIFIETPHAEYTPDKSNMTAGKFTTCGHKRPHYKVKTTSMVLYPGDKIIAYNVTLWEFNAVIPVFYTPIWIYSLKDDRQVIQVETGYNDIRGWFAKVTYNYRSLFDLDNSYLNRILNNSGQFYLDHFSRTGFAGGFKHYYKAIKDEEENMEDAAYLKVYLEDDKRYPKEPIWVTVEQGEELKVDDFKRDYTINYQNHYDDYLTTPKKNDKLDIDFEQRDKTVNWKHDLDIEYDKDRYYENNLDVDLNLDRLTDDWIDDFDLDFDYELKDRINDERVDEYGLFMNFYNRWKKEGLRKSNKFRLDFDYDFTKDFDKDREEYDEYDIDLDYKMYINNDLSLDYDFDYEHYRPMSNLDWDYDTELELEQDKRVYNLKAGTKLYRNNKEIDDYYYLPKVDVTLDLSKVWNNKYIDPLDFKFGGTNKHAKLWEGTYQEDRQYYYYELEYSDYGLRLGKRNHFRYDEAFQQNIYSTGEQGWAYSSELKLKTYLLSNWSNTVSHDYQEVGGFTSDDFSEIEELKDTSKHKIKEKLDWKKGNSDFYLKTAYDLLTESYDDLTSKLEYNFKDYYTLESALRYDLNQSWFERFGTVFKMDYGDLKYNTGAKLYFNAGELDNWKWDNELDWTFGKKDYEWSIKLNSVYDSEEEGLETANITVEKYLHCRKLLIAYDHIKGETWVSYQILAFPQSEVKFGSKNNGGMLFDDGLGGILDEIEDEE